jgi:glycosyltransferase involved in cell wall biosynthesis
LRVSVWAGRLELIYIQLKFNAVTNELLVNLSFLLTKPTGTTNYALNLLPNLQKIEPTLLTSQSLPDYNCYQTRLDQTSEQGFPGHLRRLMWTQFQLSKIYHHLRSHLLFSPIPEAPIFTNCRYIVTVHDFIPLRFPKLSSPLYHYCKSYLPQVLHQATHIICNSTTTAIETIDRFHIPETKVTPISLACDTNQFFATEEAAIAEPPYFLHLGRHAPYKNIARIIAAFARLSSRDEYELWLGGAEDRRYTPQLRAQVAELGLEGRVKFLEYIPQTALPTVIRQATALVFPSLWEGFGLPVLEAMACGTPVITSNLSALVEVAGDAAILVDPYQVQKIASAMHELSNNRALYHQLRQAGIQRARQFDWTKTARSTIRTIERYL